LAEAGSLGIMRGHASCDLSGAAAGHLAARLGCCWFRCRQALAALVRGNAPAHFLLPGRCGVGLACGCIQDSMIPSDATGANAGAQSGSSGP
jgi:hypothetical protein